MVNGLFRIIRGHTSAPLRFVCITDDATGLDPEIVIRPFPDMHMPEELLSTGCLRKLSMFVEGVLEPRLRTLYFDLDTAVLGDVARLAACLDRDHGLYMLSNHYLQHWKLRPLYRRFSPETYYFGNSSVLAYYPEDYYALAADFITGFPSVHAEAQRSGVPKPRYWRTDERWISYCARDTLPVFPDELAARFQDAYMAPSFWLSDPARQAAGKPCPPNGPRCADLLGQGQQARTPGAHRRRRSGGQGTAQDALALSGAEALLAGAGGRRDTGSRGGGAGQLTRFCLHLLLALLVVTPAPLLAQSSAFEEEPVWAITPFAGRITSNVWSDIVTDPSEVAFEGAGIVGVGVARNVLRYPFGLDVEIEGQIAKYFGDQTNFEFNIPAVARWTRFPWSEQVNTSTAFGLGLSWASKIPEFEEARYDDGTQQLLPYWFIELGFGPPKARWSIIGRLHHRSTGFGTFGESGGANTLVAGVRIER